MNRAFYYFFTAICIMMSGCNYSNNGDLDGMWYMTQIDSISSGETFKMRDTGISWSFQGKLMQIGNHRSNSYWNNPIMCYFSVKGNQLEVHDPFIYDRMKGDKEITADSIHMLKPFGINNIPENFMIEKLSSSKLQINDDIIRISFEKY